MNEKTREIIRQKFNGLCAYTGKQLDDKWQVDHLLPVQRKFKTIGAYYLNTDTGLPATIEDIRARFNSEKDNIKHIPSKIVSDGFRNPENNCIENMVPALRIVNHYKRDQDLETFRNYISTLHIRLKKLPKNTERTQTIKRKEYLYKVAEAFGISIDRPFSGKFYFETVNPLPSTGQDGG